MRLDRYLGEAGVASRSEATKRIRARQVTVNGETVRDPAVHIDPETAVVTLCGEIVRWRRFVYVMLNKPAGYVSATEDRGPTVMDLLPPAFGRMRMFPCGRLDIDTVGFLLVTNDGALAHELLSPRHHVGKTYRFRCDPPISEQTARKLETGVDIGDCVTAPASVSLYPDSDGAAGEITVCEGKFHQIKRMFASCGSAITFLERLRFGGVSLDPSLPRGEWRYLHEEEEQTLLRAAGRVGDSTEKKGDES